MTRDLNSGWNCSIQSRAQQFAISTGQIEGCWQMVPSLITPWCRGCRQQRLRGDEPASDLTPPSHLRCYVEGMGRLIELDDLHALTSLPRR